MDKNNLTELITIENIKYSYFNNKKYTNNYKKFDATLSISIDDKIIGDGALTLKYDKDDDDNIKEYIQCYGNKINSRDILYISGIFGRNIGNYLLQLVCHFAKLHNKTLIILVSNAGEGCKSEKNSCEMDSEYELLNNFNTFNKYNPFDTNNKEMPKLFCKLNRLYLNYGFFIIPKKECDFFEYKKCYMYCGTDRLSYIVDNYIKSNIKVNTTNSLKKLSKWINSEEDESELKIGNNISKLFNKNINNRNSKLLSKKYRKFMNNFKSLEKLKRTTSLTNQKINFNTLSQLKRTFSLPNQEYKSILSSKKSNSLPKKSNSLKNIIKTINPIKRTTSLSNKHKSTYSLMRTHSV